MSLPPRPLLFFFFFFNDTATTEIYTLSLHDALPILRQPLDQPGKIELHRRAPVRRRLNRPDRVRPRDRKSTRLNSSHSQISYAVFCLKKKKKYIAPRIHHVNATPVSCNKHSPPTATS